MKKTTKNIIDFYDHDLINYMRTRLDGVIYQNEETKEYYQQNDMNLNLERGANSSRWITITEEFINRPDKLAYIAYGDEQLYWIILQHNNIIDPFELTLGLEIELPDLFEIDKALDIRKEVTAYKKLEKK